MKLADNELCVISLRVVDAVCLSVIVLISWLLVTDNPSERKPSEPESRQNENYVSH